MFNKYYQDELSYLRDLGKEFAKANPATAHMLTEQGNDPDVERLLEGFAFLTGRVRQKLDDELPELTHTLMNLLWPHYLRPIPSITTIEFAPIANMLREPQIIPAATEVESAPIENTRCKFRTTYEIDMLPIRISQVTLERPMVDPVRLRIGFEIFGGCGPPLLPPTKYDSTFTARRRSAMVCICGCRIMPSRSTFARAVATT